MKKISVGVVCLARHTFDVPAATELFERTKRELRSMPEVHFEIIEEPVIETDDAEAAGAILSEKHLDGIVIISGTFHLGHLALILHKHIQKPVLLWAYEELPYNGGKIRLNAVCGVNLNASNFYKAGIDNYTCHIGNTLDTDWLNAIRVKAILRSAHVGIAGYRAHGFFNLDTEDLHVFHELGLLVDHYELSELYEQETADRGGYEHDIAALDCSGITDNQAEKVARLAASMEEFIKKNKLDGVAVRCWPEFATAYGIAPCAAMALLTDRGYTLGCEGDLEGTLSLLACRALSDEAPFMADLSQVDFAGDYALMWHCGVAAASLAHPKTVKSLDTYFAGGKGVTTDFVMKEGIVTLFRIDTARGKTRVFIERGHAEYMEKELRGTYAKLHFDNHVREVFGLVADNGIAHHVAMVYGDYIKVFSTFAAMMGYEVVTTLK
ncbi:MAG: fucose isomerase [Oscillospiraceae bacterium]|nr:fucose isomerase [Oscillospiraceae bacterium]